MELHAINKTPKIISPNPSPRPLARPLPKRLDAIENEYTTTKTKTKEEKTENIPRSESSFQIPSDPLLCHEEFRWPSEDRDDSDKISVAGFIRYKEAQAKLLEYGFSHSKIERALLDLLKSNPNIKSESLILEALTKLTDPDSTNKSEASDIDGSKDIEAINLLITWTVASLRARLKRQPNPQVPGFPINVRHQWVGLEPGRRALEIWINSSNFNSDEKSFNLLQQSLDAAMAFDPSNKSSPGEHLQLSTHGQTKLLGLLSNAAQGLKENAPREPRTPTRHKRTRVLDVDDDNNLLAVWERVGASLRATQALAPPTSPKEANDTKPSNTDAKVSTFASQAADDLKCAVCWDDLDEPGDQDIETAFESKSAVVRMPGCGHTLCAECTYQWLKSNITSGRLSGDCMRCPLANVPSATGGHGTPSGSSAAELEQQEVELLIRNTAEVGLLVEAEAKKAIKLQAAKKEKDRLKKEEAAKRQKAVNTLASGAATAFGGGTCVQRFERTSQLRRDERHTLRPFDLSSSAFSCDGGCKRVFKPGDQLFGCRRCNFDLCFSCLVEKYSFKHSLLGLLGPYLVRPCLASADLAVEETIAPPQPSLLPPPLISSSSSKSSLSSDSSLPPLPGVPESRRIVQYCETSTLKDKPLALFFGSMDSRLEEALESLKSVYPMKEDSALKDCEIVFISTGTPTTSARFFHAHMPWLAMQFYDRDVERKRLMSILNVREVPLLVIFDKNLKMVKRYELNGINTFDPLTFRGDLTTEHGMSGNIYIAQKALGFNVQSLLASEQPEFTIESKYNFVKFALEQNKTLSSEARSLLEERLQVAWEVARPHYKPNEEFSSDGLKLCCMDSAMNQEDTHYENLKDIDQQPDNETNDDEKEPVLLLKFRKFLANREAERIPGTKWCYRPGCETAILPSARRRMRATKLHNSSSSSSLWMMDTLIQVPLRCFKSLLDWVFRCIGLESVCGGPGAALVCPTCDADVCARCGKEWHGAWAGSCEAVVDLTLQEFRKEKCLQPCPNCRREVEKVDACPHMSCPCGHQWCWVCRGNFPCANLHFGKSGYGSSTEIGDVRNIQRLAVIARMVSTCCFFPIFGLFLAAGSTVWMLVLFSTGSMFCCFHGLKQLAKFEACGRLSPFVEKVRYRAKKVGKVLGYACTGFPILFGLVLSLAMFFLCIGLLHIVGLCLLPVSIVYLCAELKMWVTVRSGTVRRVWSEKGVKGLLDVLDEDEIAQEPFLSSLNTKYEVVDCSSRFLHHLLRGEPSTKFVVAYCPEKGGHLSHNFVSIGRRALASSIYALCFPPTFALGCCLAPFAPLFLLPLAVYPREPIPRHMAPLVSPLVGAFFFAIFAYLVPIWFHGLASTFDPAQAGLIPSIIPGCIATVIAWVLLRTPALSSCSCCAPLWLVAYSIPLSLIVGERKSRSYLAFTSVPDIILQLPTMFIMLFIEHLLEQ